MTDTENPKHPFISIIIPSYNREVLIQETLNSILSQSFENWECIIVDDASTDDSLAVIKKYESNDSRFKAFCRPIERPKGPSSCRNFGFTQSAGDYILFFDSDDIMEPDMLECVASAIRNSSAKVELVRTCYDLFFTSPLKAYYYATYRMGGMNVLQAACSNISWIRPSTLVWRRELLARQTSLWNEQLMRFEDYELFFRLFMDFENPANVIWLEEKTLVHARSSHGSLSAKKVTIQMQQLLYKISTDFFTACKNSQIISSEYLEKNLEYLLQLQMQMICTGWHDMARQYEHFIRTQSGISNLCSTIADTASSRMRKAFYYRIIHKLRVIKASLIPLAVKEMYWKIRYPNPSKDTDIKK